MSETILDRLRSFDGQQFGLLFHGTSETFELPPRPGAYDEVLWTATSPVIAQSYIPKAGTSLYGYHPDQFRLRERVWPSQNDFWYTVVREMGFSALDVELDAYGSLKSWRLPDAYPTYGEAVEWLRGLGYDLRPNEAVKISCAFEDGVEKIKRADWCKPGRLLVTVGDELRLFDYAAGKESDLTELEYHKLEVFRSVEAKGYDGIVINDFLQDEDHGNVGHRSVGLFAAAVAKLPWLEIPAVHSPWQSGKQTTPEIEAYLATPDGLPPAPVP